MSIRLRLKGELDPHLDAWLDEELPSEPGLLLRSFGVESDPVDAAIVEAAPETRPQLRDAVAKALKRYPSLLSPRFIDTVTDAFQAAGYVRQVAA
jgi:hypothetical protein